MTDISKMYEDVLSPWPTWHRCDQWPSPKMDKLNQLVVAATSEHVSYVSSFQHAALCSCDCSHMMSWINTCPQTIRTCAYIHDTNLHISTSIIYIYIIIYYNCTNTVHAKVCTYVYVCVYVGYMYMYNYVDVHAQYTVTYAHIRLHCLHWHVDT